MVKLTYAVRKKRSSNSFPIVTLFLTRNERAASILVRFRTHSRKRFIAMQGAATRILRFSRNTGCFIVARECTRVVRAYTHASTSTYIHLYVCARVYIYLYVYPRTYAAHRIEDMRFYDSATRLDDSRRPLVERRLFPSFRTYLVLPLAISEERENIS